MVLTDDSCSNCRWVCLKARHRMPYYSCPYVLLHIAQNEHWGVTSAVVMWTQHVWKDLILTTLVFPEAPSARVKGFCTDLNERARKRSNLCRSWRNDKVGEGGRVRGRQKTDMQRNLCRALRSIRTNCETRRKILDLCLVWCDVDIQA